MAFEEVINAMRESMQNSLDELASPRSSTKVKRNALHNLERHLATACLATADEGVAKDAFLALLYTFECNVPAHLLPWISRSTLRLDSLITKALNPDERSEIEELSSQLSLALTIIQGIILIHEASKAYMGRQAPLEIILDLLLSSRHLASSDDSGTGSSPTKPVPIPSASTTTSQAPTQHLTSTVLDTLLCILVDSPLALRTFESTSGVQAVVKILKRAGTPREVRMKCLEFLYFYLLDETPSGDEEAKKVASSVIAQTKTGGGGGGVGVNLKPKRSGSTTQVQPTPPPTAPATPASSARPTKPFISGTPMRPSSRYGSSTFAFANSGSGIGTVGSSVSGGSGSSGGSMNGGSTIGGSGGTRTASNSSTASSFSSTSSNASSTTSTSTNATSTGLGGGGASPVKESFVLGAGSQLHSTQAPMAHHARNPLTVMTPMKVLPKSPVKRKATPRMVPTATSSTGSTGSSASSRSSGSTTPGHGHGARSASGLSDNSSSNGSNGSNNGGNINKGNGNNKAHPNPRTPPSSPPLVSPPFKFRDFGNNAFENADGNENANAKEAKTRPFSQFRLLRREVDYVPLSPEKPVFPASASARPVFQGTNILDSVNSASPTGTATPRDGVLKRATGVLDDAAVIDTNAKMEPRTPLAKSGGIGLGRPGHAKSLSMSTATPSSHSRSKLSGGLGGAGLFGVQRTKSGGVSRDEERDGESESGTRRSLEREKARERPVFRTRTPHGVFTPPVSRDASWENVLGTDSDRETKSSKGNQASEEFGTSSTNGGAAWKTTEEKRELLGTMLGNVDALVEGVRKAGIWGLG